jgi:hypothetical protein
MGNRSITKMEMLLAIAMSEFFEKTHVLFIPPKTSYRQMLKTLVNSKEIEPISISFYKVTTKGHAYIQLHYEHTLIEADAQIDKFVDGL